MYGAFVMRPRILLIAISLFSATYSAGENTVENDSHFINITTQSGLANNNVYGICTDKNGCIWLATGMGLSHYDGLTVKNHFKEEMKIRSNVINYVYYDSRDRVWAGSTNGVAVYDVNKEKFFSLELLAGTAMENKTAWFFEDSKGTMWVSFKKHGLISVEPDTYNTKQYFYNLSTDKYFSRIWFEPENNLYLAAQFNNGLCYIDLENQTTTPFIPADAPHMRPFAGKQIKGFVKIDEKNFCITCSDGDIYMVNPYDRTYEIINTRFTHSELRRAFRVSEHHLAIAMTDGFFIYNISERRVEENERYSKLFDGKSVHCIAGDLDNGLIVGLHGMGMSIEQDAGFRFVSVSTDTKNPEISLRGSNVTGFAESNDSTIWISTRQKGLFCYSKKDKRLRRYENPSLPESLEGVIFCNDMLWTLSADGIYKVNIQNGKVWPYSEGYGKNYCMKLTGEGEIEVLSDGGIQHYDKTEDRFSRSGKLAGLTIHGIGTGSNSLIAMTAEKGLIRWDGHNIKIEDKGRVRHGLIKEWPEIIYEDNIGRIWSSPSGAGIFISCDDHHHLLNTRSGLSSDIITNIIGDDRGNIFVSTDRSLTMIPPTGKMTTLTKSDGLLNFGFTRDASYKTSDGDILLGSRDGFTIINGIRNTAKETQTTLKIEQLYSDGTEVAIKGESFYLNHRQNSFDLSITDIDPHHMQAGNSLYSLDGHDNTWIPAGEDRKVSYAGLKPGKYTLRSFNPYIRPLHIRVAPHPLLSAVPIIGYISAAVALLIFGFIYVGRNEKRRKHAMELEARLKELTEEANATKDDESDAEPSEDPKEDLSLRESLLLSKLREAVEQNYTDPEFGVDALADALGLSRSSLNRRMREIMDTTANNYIREARLEKAEELLRTSSLQINEICYKVGFQTPSYFIKCFRKKYGKSPNEYANSSK